MLFQWQKQSCLLTVFIQIEAQVLNDHWPGDYMTHFYILHGPLECKPLHLFGPRHLYDPSFYSDKYGT